MIHKPSDEYIESERLAAKFQYYLSFQDQLFGANVVDNSRIIATQLIPKGTLIYRGTPVVSYNERVSEKSCRIICVLSGKTDEKVASLSKLLSNLYPRTDEEYYKTLSLCYPDCTEFRFTQINSIEVKLKINKFSTRGDEFCVYDTGSKFNHSCNPNCIERIDNDNCLTVYSAKDLSQGEECFIAYDRGLCLVPSTDYRREKLLDGFFFHCQCSKCSEMDCVMCKTNTGTMLCGKCKRVRYCGRECQKAHWKSHRLTCQM